jgi:hypothetical protein
MFDFWRNLTKSKAEKEQELLHAYIDNALSPSERADFEARLAHDVELRAQVNSIQRMQQLMAAVPRRRVPRNFTLDPAEYGRPARQPLLQAQPALRLATAVTAIIFVIVLALDWKGPGMMQTAVFEADMVAQEEVAVRERSVEVITETITEEMEIFQITADEVEVEIEVEAAPEAAPIEEGAMMVAPESEPYPVATNEAEAMPAASPEPTTPPVTEAVDSDLVTRTITTETEVVVTAVPPTNIPSSPTPITSIQWLQLGLGALLALLFLLLLMARRQASI